VEILGAILACIAAGSLGFFAGGHWGPGPLAGAFLGIPLGALVAPLYFILALMIGETLPGALDARLIGLFSMGLVIAGATCGAIGAWFGYRKSMGARLF
jgi:hypothetical protein